MKIDRLVLGDFETNCYILRKSGDATECLLIDTGLDVEPLLEYLDKYKLKPVAAVITHGHIDHIAGIDTLRKKYPSMAVCIHKADARLLTDAVSNLSFMTGEPVTAGSADYLVEDGHILDFAGVKLRVIHTPGHTPGGICLYAEAEGLIFGGDTLFAGSIGRTDFPGGDMELLVEGIKQKLLTLPEKTVVYPGHGPQTTIKREKAENPFLQ
jgi:glyoxylase-like metal-dependent hydrolase (beta-lactamase superfamily II)